MCLYIFNWSLHCWMMNCVLCQTILCLGARKSARCLIEMIESMATSTLLRYRFKAQTFFYVCTPPELLSTFLFCALQQRDEPSSQDMKGKQKSRSSRFDKFLKMILKSFQKKKKFFQSPFKPTESHYKHFVWRIA